MAQAIIKSGELVALQTRHRRRMEKELYDREGWKEIGAYWSSIDKLRVKVTAHMPDAMAREEAVKLEQAAVKGVIPEAGFEYVRQNVMGHVAPVIAQGTPLKFSGLEYAPEALKVRVQTPGGKHGRVIGIKSAGVHIEGTPHYGVSSGMEGRGMRGRGDLHGGAKTGGSRPGALELAMAARDIEKMELEWLKAKQEGNKNYARKLAWKIKRAKEEYADQEYAFKIGGNHLNERLNTFAERNSKGKAAAEKIKEEGRKDYK